MSNRSLPWCLELCCFGVEEFLWGWSSKRIVNTYSVLGLDRVWCSIMPQAVLLLFGGILLRWLNMGIKDLLCSDFERSLLTVGLKWIGRPENQFDGCFVAPIEIRVSK